jgi:hypothetical protein
MTFLNNLKYQLDVCKNFYKIRNNFSSMKKLIVNAKKLTLICNFILGILIIIANFLPFISTLFAGETHKYYLNGTIFIIEALGTTRYSALIPGEFISIIFMTILVISWISAIILVINAILIAVIKKKQYNSSWLLSIVVGILVIVINLIGYFSFPFVGAGITLYPDIGFALTLIPGVAANGTGISEIIKRRSKS